MPTGSRWVNTATIVTAPRRRSYDHRLRLAIATTGDPTLFPRVEIPASTRRSWTTRPAPNVVALHREDQELVELQVALARAEASNARLRAVIRLLLALTTVLGGCLGNRRVHEAADKARLLAAVRRAEPVLGRAASLRVLDLTPARLREWKRRQLACELEDVPSCPKQTPQQLTFSERRTIRDYVESFKLRHLSVASLALLAGRRGDAFASVNSWYREIRRQGLRRPRRRVHPACPRVGVRASAPNETWHIDASRVRLLDGRVVWMHAVIDNFSRKILAWTVGGSCKADATDQLLRQAVRFLAPDAPSVTVVTDGGSENGPVEHEDFAGLLHRVCALVDVTYSNSLIESFWSQLKHRWLFLHELDTAQTVERLVAKFVEDHNAFIPRAALGGRTPDEVFLGTEEGVPAGLAVARAEACADRVAVNRALVRCGGCDGPGLGMLRWEVVDAG
jgi:transposase InsO family protein